MIVVSVDFPDERTGVAHLHSQFRTDQEANRWINVFRTEFGHIQATKVTVQGLNWTCDDCRSEVKIRSR